jgi:polyhydroxyalkanoate synthesis regulator phasin
MSAGNFPIIRLELERMRHSILAAIGPALEAEQTQIAELVDQAVKSFDFSGQVRAEVFSQLNEQIHEATKRAVQKAFLADEVQAIFAEQATKTVRQTLEYMERVK